MVQHFEELLKPELERSIPEVYSNQQEQEGYLPKEELRQFSKEHSPEERQQITAEIRSRRKEYFERKQELEGEIRELTARAEEKETKLDEVIKEISDIETTLEERKTSKILKLLHYFELKRLEKEIEEKYFTQEQFEKEYREIGDTLQALHEQQEDRWALDEAKEVLRRFYQGQQEKWEAYEEDQKIRNVANIANQHDVVFVHGIHPSFIPDTNSLLNKGIDWKTKLKILLSLEPTISTSTIKEGDGAYNMWARMGVLLNGGSVLDASPVDAGTVARGLKKRGSSGKSGPVEMRTRIDKAITERKEGYNELVVENPKVAGFYVCLDSHGNIIREDLAPQEQIIESARELGMPLYVIKGGAVFETEYDLQTKQFQQKRKLTPEEIMQKNFQLSEMQKQKLTLEIFADSPFRIESPEVQQVDSRDQGKQTYIEINVPKNPSGFDGEESIYVRKKGLESGDFIGDGTKMKVISSFPLRGAIAQYVLTDRGLFRRRENTKTGEVIVSFIKQFDEYGHGYINLGFNTHNLERPINDSEAYLIAMGVSIEKRMRERSELIGQEKYKGQTEFYDEWLKKLAFHLYGFGEQASQFGDAETQAKAFELAKKVLPQEQYQEVLKRRIDEHGRFKITREDLM